jgi:hypothetical protein
MGQAHDHRFLHVVIADRGGFLEAQSLELALAVSAIDQDGLVRAFEHAIICEFEIANEHGLTPFVRLLDRAPKDFPNEFEGASFEDMGQLKLPAEVGLALAAVLRAPEPVLHLSRLNKAA